MSTSVPTAPGLRERKRAETRAAIERVAIEQVHEHGFDNVSVEQICELVGISPRTFFNYFGTKESAVFGSVIIQPGPADLAVLAQGESGDLLDDLLTMMARLRTQSPIDARLSRLRKEIIRLDPVLLQSMYTRIQGMEALLAEAVAERLQREHPELGDSERGREATLHIQLGMALMRTTTMAILEGLPDGELLPMMRRNRERARQILG